MVEYATIAVVSATFVVAGLVKGVIGMGLPTVSLAILTLATDLPSAMALLLAPSLFTNIWQALHGKHLYQLCRDFWPFLLPAMLTTGIGVAVSDALDVRLLSTLLGFLLISYAGYGLSSARLVSRQQQPDFNTTRAGVTHYGLRHRVTGAIMGSINGLLTGLTGSFVVPGVMYLQSQKFPRDRLIQAMGILFTVSTLALGLALIGEKRISAPIGWLSIAATIPAFAGMILGQRLRKTLSETTFRRVFFLTLLLIGVYIIMTSLLLD